MSKRLNMPQSFAHLSFIDSSSEPTTPCAVNTQLSDANHVSSHKFTASHSPSPKVTSYDHSLSSIPLPSLSITAASSSTPVPVPVRARARTPTPSSTPHSFSQRDAVELLTGPPLALTMPALHPLYDRREIPRLLIHADSDESYPVSSSQAHTRPSSYASDTTRSLKTPYLAASPSPSSNTRNPSPASIASTTSHVPPAPHNTPQLGGAEAAGDEDEEGRRKENGGGGDNEDGKPLANEA
ncbi:uncharacterized protein EHS24_002933 [Apiotrichum porosum]|uniref:Uncharacterized protein n=1 Tax=Apiotrichum porosum TaxID=105984 RepID=A0A427XGH5_9TREE|nr:uncharacterized protein EHS24_002933 [Apiotrichum porosum]RSH77867.1 hypothetical protein EHS24_002933 [Apiotrichum porosum]